MLKTGQTKGWLKCCDVRIYHTTVASGEMDRWMMGNRRRIWMRLTKAQADGVFSWMTD